MNDLLLKAYNNFKEREGREPDWNEIGCEMIKLTGNR